jgi:hypothetical protein
VSFTLQRIDREMQQTSAAGGAVTVVVLVYQQKTAIKHPKN